MKSKNKIVYIAGKITGNPNYEEEFAIAEKELSRLGYIVVNPVAISKALPQYPNLPYDFYFDVVFSALEHCDAICPIGAWTESRGASYEFDYAIFKGMEIIDAVQFPTA